MSLSFILDLNYVYHAALYATREYFARVRKMQIYKKNNLWQGKQRQNQILFLAHFRPQVNVSPCLEEAVRVFVEVLFAGNQ